MNSTQTGTANTAYRGHVAAVMSAAAEGCGQPDSRPAGRQCTDRQDSKVKKKGKIRSRSAIKGPELKYRYSSTLTLTSSLNGCGWSTPRPGRFTSGNEPVSVVHEAGWAPGPVWTGLENLAATEIRSPDCPTRSE
jgi:hypothetical protein